MKKIFSFLKKSTFITALCLIIAGSIMLPKFGNSSENESSYGTFAFNGPDNDERPVGPDGVETY